MDRVDLADDGKTCLLYSDGVVVADANIETLGVSLREPIVCGFGLFALICAAEAEHRFEGGEEITVVHDVSPTHGKEAFAYRGNRAVAICRAGGDIRLLSSRMSLAEMTGIVDEFEKFAGH